MSPAVTKVRADAYFAYDAESGHLFHKLRPRSEFANATKFARHLNIIGTKAGHVDFQGYVSVSIDGKRYPAHRIIWMMVHGEMPAAPKSIVDHINRVRSDNRLTNLRVVDFKGNTRNKGLSPKNKSGVPDVLWRHRQRKWYARITDNGKRIGLGYFHLFEDAVSARQEAEKRLGYPVSASVNHPLSLPEGASL